MSNNGKIPVSTAKFVAHKHNLSQCLLIGWDGEFVHVVTYGKTPADCEAAAKAQDFWTGKIREFSFRGEHAPPPVTAHAAYEAAAQLTKFANAHPSTYGHEPALMNLAADIRIFLAALPPAALSASPDGWEPIDDANPPMGRIVLLAYYRDLGEPTDCWIIASGSRGAPKNDRWDDDDYTPWRMDGRSLRSTDWLPTMWQPLPTPPALTPGEGGNG